MTDLIQQYNRRGSATSAAAARTEWTTKVAKVPSIDGFPVPAENSISKPSAEAHCQLRRHIEGKLELERRASWYYFLWFLVPMLWNIPVLWQALVHDTSLLDLGISLNFLIIVTSRNEFFVWSIYILLTTISARLSGRSRFKIFLNRLTYNLGGIHVSSAMCLMVFLIAQISTRSDEVDTVCFSALLLAGIIVISIFACPAYRHEQKHHDHFEYSHRFVGWLLAIIVGVQIIYNAIKDDGATWRYAPTYLLAISVFLVAWPWLTMMRITMDIDAPSKMVTTLTTAQSPVFACAGTAGRVSFGFASQYHSFAILNALSGGRGSTFAVSSIGDWTKKLNAKGADGGCKYPSAAPKQHIMYVRRFAAPGFMYLARTYKRVVCVGTGAGIAPIASFLPEPPANMLLLWVGRDFQATYGALHDLITKHKDLIMVDTTLPSSAENPYEPMSKEVLYSSAISPAQDSANIENQDSPVRKQSIAEETLAYLEAQDEIEKCEMTREVKIDMPGAEPKVCAEDITAIACSDSTDSVAAAVGTVVQIPPKKKRPNLTKLALAAVEVYKADAVFIVSGPKPTYDLTHALWKRAIPAYGATWDS